MKDNCVKKLNVLSMIPNENECSCIYRGKQYQINKSHEGDNTKRLDVKCTIHNV